MKQKSAGAASQKSVSGIGKRSGKKPHKRKHSGGRDDTQVSAAMLKHAVAAIMKRRIVDHSCDVPYLAGYGRDGRTIYIDRHVPVTFTTRGRRVKTEPFLVLHEAVEKALLEQLGLVYQHAHQIALRAEEAAVRASGVSWKEYDRFMQQYIKEVSDERLSRLPRDLDIKPYRDEHDAALLKRMVQARKRDGKEPEAGKGRR